MRTTVDLPDDIHSVVVAIARDSGTSLSGTVARLLRAALRTPGPLVISTSERTGLRVVSTGQAVTSDDVRSLEDDG